MKTKILKALGKFLVNYGPSIVEAIMSAHAEKKAATND